MSEILQDKYVSHFSVRNSKIKSCLIEYYGERTTSTKKKESVAAWNITYHEFLGTSIFFKQITYINNDNEELKIHHEYTKAATQNCKNAVAKILDYLEN